MFLERMMRFFNGFPVVSAPKSMKEVKIDFRVKFAGARFQYPPNSVLNAK